jgi:glucosamine--fructose-6-phosphate aminotransferase (isomerizing)
MFVIGRGVEFATAREIALKLLETCRIAAEPLTATDLAHGPVAALDPLFPVWAIASSDGTLATVQEAAAASASMGATLVASGNGGRADQGRGVTRARADAANQPSLPPALRRSGPALRGLRSRGRGARPDAPHGSRR